MTKRIVIACDGTWNRPDQVHDGQVSPTNVVKIALAVAPEGQQVFYERGVGTGRLDRIRGGAFGVGLSRNVRSAYRFLCQCYEPEDELFLFGFSRGAFTARSLAGLIGNCGILRPEHLDRVGDAYDLYKARAAPTKPTGIEARLFRRSYAHEDTTPIAFIGVWDTVGALGIPLSIPILTKRWSFHDVQLGTHVQTAIHALAIDERRRPFVPTLWTQQPEAPATQTLEQVWFTGVHSDVGGGYPDPRLADIPLLWMAARARAAGLVLKEGWFTPTDAPDQERRHAGQDVRPDALGERHDSFGGAYRVLGPGVRDLRPTERGAVASSAVRRVAEDPREYDPDNLRRYREAQPPPPVAQVVEAV
jgi:uncharacterized protein (DUF2235 family)